ncbi:MAG: cupin domain-containing protein [Bacteroidetes bacterium]|nr:cupin domain-containing protein [Bacteroidota bacterium]
MDLQTQLKEVTDGLDEVEYVQQQLSDLLSDKSQEIPSDAAYITFADPKANFCDEDIETPLILHHGKHMQVSLSVLHAGQVIHREHHSQDQIIIPVTGNIAVSDFVNTHEVYQNEVVVIPGDTGHKVIHRGTKPAKLLTIYSPKAHEGSRYEWPEEDEPFSADDKKGRVDLVYSISPLEALASSKTAYQTDIACTKHTTVGIASIVAKTNTADRRKLEHISWNREGYFIVLSGNGIISVGQVEASVSNGDLIYCAGMESETDSNYKIIPQDSSTLFVLYVTSNAHAAECKPPLACGKSGIPLVLEMAAEELQLPPILHAGTVPTPMILDTYVAEEIPETEAVEVRNKLLEDIRGGVQLRKTPERKAVENTNTLKDQLMTALAKRREQLEKE